MIGKWRVEALGITLAEMALVVAEVPTIRRTMQLVQQIAGALTEAEQAADAHARAAQLAPAHSDIPLNHLMVATSWEAKLAMNGLGDLGAVVADLAGGVDRLRARLLSFPGVGGIAARNPKLSVYSQDGGVAFIVDTALTLDRLRDELAERIAAGATERAAPKSGPRSRAVA